MQRITTNIKTAGSIIALATFMFLHAGLIKAEESGDETVSGGVAEDSPERAARTPVAAQGMRVYRDPKTGRLGSPPPGVQPPGLSVAEQHMLNRSDQGLQSRTLPGGGVAVDLQGRYRSMAVATVGEEGPAAVNCVHTPEQATASVQVDEKAGAGSAD